MEQGWWIVLESAERDGFRCNEQIACTMDTETCCPAAGQNSDEL